MTDRSVEAPEARAATAAPVAHRNPLTAGGWSGLSFIVGNIIGALVYIPLARILSSADFGLFAEANLLYLAFVLLAEGAVAQALVQMSGDPERPARAALWLSSLAGLAGTAICAAAAPLMAAIYRDEELTTLLLVMAPGVLLSGLGAVPHALLSRELDFRRKTLPETLSLGAGGIVALATALAGLGVYSLALMTVAQPAISSTTAWWVCRRRPSWTRPASDAMRRVGGLWLNIGVGDVALYARLNTDYALTGRLLGTAPLGVYSIAWSTSAGPLLFITAFTGRVGFALFSRLQYEQERLRAVFLSAVRLIATAALPVFLAAVVISPDLVPVVLGRRWEPAVGPLMVLFLLQLVRTIAGPGASLVLALGRGRLYAAVGAAALPATVAAVLTGTHGGVTGVALAMTLAAGGVALAYLLIALRLLEVRPREAMGALTNAVVLAAVAVPAVAGGRFVLLNVWEAPQWARLVASIVAGLLAVGVVLQRMWPSLRADVQRLRHAVPDVPTAAAATERI